MLVQIFLKANVLTVPHYLRWIASSWQLDEMSFLNSVFLPVDVYTCLPAEMQEVPKLFPPLTSLVVSAKTREVKEGKGGLTVGRQEGVWVPMLSEPHQCTGKHTPFVKLHNFITYTSLDLYFAFM